MKIAICDNEILFLKQFLTLCQSFSCIDKIVPFQNGDLLLAEVKAGSSFDAVFMDIDFGNKKTGIEYSKELYKINPQIRLVYITSFTDRFVQHVFLSPSNMIGFLTKPVDKGILSSILDKLQTSLEQDKQTLFCIVGKSDSISVPISSIFYLESKAHRSLIYTDTE
ncbi:MAG: response regulator, partial [Lachnospiraceae bacterium]|nr:response regulator [Lachnospiraceae bacterium]